MLLLRMKRILIMKCIAKYKMPQEGKSFWVFIFMSKCGPSQWTLLPEGLLRTCVVLSLILTTALPFLERRCFVFFFFCLWNWFFLSTAFVPGWMDNGQSMILEVTLSRGKCQAHLLISILWGFVCWSVTGCHVRGWAFVRTDRNNGHTHLAWV